MKLLPQLLNTKHQEIQLSVMSLVAECCRLRPKAENKIITEKYKKALKKCNQLSKILGFMLNKSSEHATESAKIILGLIDDDPSIYKILLKNDGVHVVYKALQKFQ